MDGARADARSRWESRYASIAVDDLNPEPAGILSENIDLLPTTGSAIDIAGGSGRNALWLAERGLQTTLLDISPTGLDLAERWAQRRNLSIATIAHDLEVDGLPVGQWDLAVITLFFVAEIVSTVDKQLAPGGIVFFAQPTHTNLERHARPSERFLLADGQIAALAEDLSASCEVIEATEEWRSNDVHEGRLIARKF